MTKQELLKVLQDFEDDAVVIILDEDNKGWTNIEDVKKHNSAVAEGALRDRYNQRKISAI